MNRSHVDTAIDPEKTHLKTEVAHARPLTACVWDPQGRALFFGAEDNGLHRVDLETKQVTTLEGHDSWVRAIAVTPDGARVLSGGYDGRLIWWSAAGGESEPQRVVDAHDGWIRSVAVSSDGKRVATCGNDRLVQLWDTASGKLLRKDTGHEHHVYNVAFSPGGDRLVSCDLHGYVRQWDLSEQRPPSGEGGSIGTPRAVTRVETLHKYDTKFRADIGGARCVAFSSDGERLALGGITNVTNAFAGVGEAVAAVLELRAGESSSDGEEASGEEDSAVKDGAAGKDASSPGEEAAGDEFEVQLMTTEDKPRGTLWGIAQHAVGFWVGVAGGGGGGWLYFWRDGESEPFFTHKLKSDGRGMTLSPGGEELAVAHADRQLRIYRLLAEAS